MTCWLVFIAENAKWGRSCVVLAEDRQDAIDQAEIITHLAGPSDAVSCGPYVKSMPPHLFNRCLSDDELREVDTHVFRLWIDAETARLNASNAGK